MTRDQFKLIHSELIQQVQCIEYNLKLIYAAMRKGNFQSNFQSLTKPTWEKLQESWKIWITATIALNYLKTTMIPLMKSEI